MGTKGAVYEKPMALVDIDIDKNQSYKDLMKLVDKWKQIMYANFAETPEDTQHAVKFGAEWFVPYRAHVFMAKEAKPLFQLRKMIVSKTEKRREALNGLFKYVKKDVKDTLSVMNGIL